ncbi:ribonuclease P protein component [Nonlabens mediterrranea]|uniref:Ribonuclease P protein component n=1 Tax=Nonlabens mediterrranea TaxID=1419947 RepID=A0ABS0A9Y8_9FLAO|nr:ribonuclease P protein component [Nonlabens mediterrranea]
MRFTLGKDTKLKSKKAIEELFTNGKSIRKGPVRCVFTLVDHAQPHKIGVSVSKRFFKKAPDRNRIKRLLREAYRLNQHDLITPEGKSIEMMFLFQSPKMPEFETVQQLIKKLIIELNKQHQQLED